MKKLALIFLALLGVLAPVCEELRVPYFSSRGYVSDSEIHVAAQRLAKYDRDGAVRIRDVLFLTHAKPKDAAQEKVWKELVDGKLAAADTWEVSLSGGADKRETFERLITEKKLGALALLRNLRGMQAAGVPKSVIGKALDAMRTDRVLPYRFIAAAQYAPDLEPELEHAMFRSIEGHARPV